MLKIAHLYYDLLNLYGESGNIKALDYELTSKGTPHKIDYISLGDPIDFDKYDMVYIGAGTARNLALAEQDLKQYIAAIRKFISQDKLFLATGSSAFLFGQNRLKIAKNYTSKKAKDRIVREVYAPYRGFENQDEYIENSFYRERNFIATTIIGPILARNPDFTEEIINTLNIKSPQPSK